MDIAKILSKIQTPSKGSGYFEAALNLVTTSGQINSNFYIVRIKPNGLLLKGIENIPLLCVQASLPGKVLATTTQKTYGPLQKFPIMTTFDDIGLSFMCIPDSDGQMYPRILFERWMEYINPQNKYNFKYKDEYSCSIDIEIYDKAGDQTYSLTLNEAFPLALQSQTVSFGAQDFMFCSAIFTYVDYSYIDIAAGIKEKTGHINEEKVDKFISSPIDKFITPKFELGDVIKYTNPKPDIKNLLDVKFEHTPIE